MRKRLICVLAVAILFVAASFRSMAEGVSVTGTPLESAPDQADASLDEADQDADGEALSPDETFLTAIGMASYTLSKDETYLFQNIGETASDIHMNGYFDYVLYEADDTIKNYDCRKNGTTISVPAGGKIVVTSINTNGLTCSAISDKFTGETRENPAMLRASIAYGESYEYANTGEKAYNLITNGYFDYVLYEADNTIKNYDCRKNGTTISVPAGGKVLVTSINTNGLTCAAVYDKFTGETRENPAMLRASIAYGKSYEYANTGEKEYSLFTSGYFDYVLYDADGSIKNYSWRRDSSTISVPAGGKIVVTSTNTNGLTCAAVYDNYK